MLIGVIGGVESESGEETARKSTSRCLNSNIVFFAKVVFFVHVGKSLDF